MKKLYSLICFHLVNLAREVLAYLIILLIIRLEIDNIARILHFPGNISGHGRGSLPDRGKETIGLSRVILRLLSRWRLLRLLTATPKQIIVDSTHDYL